MYHYINNLTKFNHVALLSTTILILTKVVLKMLCNTLKTQNVEYCVMCNTLLKTQQRLDIDTLRDTTDNTIDLT